MNFEKQEDFSKFLKSGLVYYVRVYKILNIVKLKEKFIHKLYYS